MDSAEADASRVAAQIVSGIGFLGAGIIIYRKHEIHGLTTAAGVWATSGVGMAAGAGLYIVAAGATVILIAVQCLFHMNCKLFRTKKYFQIKICFLNGGEECGKVKELFQTDRFNRLVIERKGKETLYHATLNTDEEYSSARLQEIMAENPFIKSIERCDEGWYRFLVFYEIKKDSEIYLGVLHVFIEFYMDGLSSLKHGVILV